MSVQGKGVAVLGGDRRMAETVPFFVQAGAVVRLVGHEWEDRLAAVQVCTSAAEALRGAHVALLPVEGVNEDGRINTVIPDYTCSIDVDALKQMARDAVVFSGLANAYLRRICAEAGRPLIIYREADEFAIWNAVPSAEGAIQMAMEATPFTLFGSRSLVVGFGRTGRTIAMLLRGLCSNVSVAARSALDHARIWASGHRPVEWERLPEAVAESDVIFNTVPALVLTREVLAAAPSHAVIIDIASAPGGTDFEAARELGLTAKLAPGLPGIVAPVTAGKLIAELVIRHLTMGTREEEPR